MRSRSRKVLRLKMKRVVSMTPKKEFQRKKKSQVKVNQKMMNQKKKRKKSQK
jgi:hypothetical protein